MEETDSNSLQEPLLQNEVAMEGADPKAALKQEQRERVANKMMERLKMLIPLSGQEGLQELRKIAVRLEEEIYAEAASQKDYLRKIFIQMMKLKANSQSSMAYSLNSNAASSSENTQDPASQSMQSQTQSQGQQFPSGMVFDQPQVQSQNIQNNISSTVMPNFTGSAPVLPPLDGKSQGIMPSGRVPVQNPDVKNMYNANPFAPMMQGWPTYCMFPFGPSQIQGGQQHIMPQSVMKSHIQQQQKTNLSQLNLQELVQQQSNTLLNSVVSAQSQGQQQLLPQNIQNNNASTVVLNSAGLTPSTTQSHMQPQQKQNLLQPNQSISQPLMSLNQSQPGQLQQQLYLQQRLQSTGPVLQPQTPIDQQKQLFQFQSQSERGYSKLKKKTVTALKKMHAMQPPPMPLNEGQVNSQTQAMNIQSSMVIPTQQHTAFSSASSVPNSHPNMLGELKSGSNIDPGQSNVLNQRQQVATNSLQQNLVGGSQPLTIPISSQNGLTALQLNSSSLQSNSNAVQPQQVNPLQQVSQQLMQQQYQQAQMLQQQYMQKLLQQQQQQQQQMMHQLIQQQQQQLVQHFVQKQQQHQQNMQKQSAQQLIQQQQQTSQKQSEQQLIQKQPPVLQQQQQASQKQSAQHVIQLQEQTSEMPPGQQRMRITAFLKLVCQVLLLVLLIMFILQNYDA